MASYSVTVICSSPKTEVYNPKTVFPHAALLHQAFAHCAIFPTAASRRSLGRVSVPMWPFILSDRLLIVALVGLYPHQLANQTQAHLQAEAFSEASFSKCLMRYSYIHSVLAPLSKCCPHLEGRLLTRYSPVRHLVFTEINTPFDLHVLSTPPAFVLSQDQTLHDRLFVWLFIALLAQIIARYFYLAHRFYSFAVLFSFQRIIALQAT